jgi:hypothetical protein
MKEQIKQFVRYQVIKSWVMKYERLLMPVTLLAGVIFDSFTFANIDTREAFILLGIYLSLSGALIIFLNAYESSILLKEGNFLKYLRLSAPFIIQFAFGGMLNATFIFYFFSGSFAVSWPFIVPVVGLMVLNEVLRHYHVSRPLVQLSVYYFILFALSSIILPYLTASLGARIFLLAGAISLFIMAAYFLLAMKFSAKIAAMKKKLAVIVLTIYVVLNGLYFSNVIPPVPLSLRDVTLAYNVRRAGGVYTLQVEEQPFWEKMIFGRVFHEESPGRLYVFTSIFAPADLSTNVVHRWQQYDDKSRMWVTRDTLSYTLSGGKKSGYRGYSFKTNVAPGKWRVDVETPRGQVLGRVNFSVESVDTPPTTQTVTK